jgi:uncharacterized protein YecA (UPF0149 family)
MTPQDIMTAFAKRGPLPLEALQAAGQMRSDMVPEFLACIERLLAANIDTASDEDLSAFLFIFHLLGEWRDQSAYRPLTLLLRHDPEFLEALIGDGITETSGRVIAGVFDGDLLPIFAAIDDTAADSFIRGQMFDALVISTLDDPRHKPQVIDFLRKFFDENGIDTPEEVWSSWAFAIAALGASDLKPLVAQVYEDQRISPMHSSFDFFEEELQTAIETGTPKWFKRSRNAELISDAVEELSHWHCFSDEYLNPKPKPPRTDNPFSSMFGLPFEHSTPQVGRNDPCPCGSGKKFKKCCLH